MMQTVQLKSFFRKTLMGMGQTFQILYIMTLNILVVLFSAITNIIQAFSDQALPSRTGRCTQRCWEGLCPFLF